jgi:signal transduction histidine kinase
MCHAALFVRPLVFWLLIALGFPTVAAAEALPRSVLILDQSNPGVPWYIALSAAFRSTLNANSASPVVLYAENLDLSRFDGPQYQKVLDTYLRDKYRDKPIDVIVAVGAAALELALRLRTDFWAETPIVFTAVDHEAAARLNLPAGVTGTTIRLSLHNAVTAARALAPNLQRIALVGDPLDRQPFRRHFAGEVAQFATQLEFIDLTGLPMTEVRARVAVLPDDAVVLFTTVTLDGAGLTYIPRDALLAVAAVANRPVVIDAETLIGFGATGGFVAIADPMGRESAALALRILNGERASDIPITLGDFIRPVFDWRQLQRFGISAARLPLGSEIRFRTLGIWEQYYQEIIAIVAIVLLQTAMIGALLFERRRRRRAELEARRRLMEIAHIDRTLIAGVMSSSIAHELNQPLGAILSNAEAAEILVGADPIDREQLKEILADIRRDDQRAGDIIEHLRGLLKKGELRLQDINLSQVIADVLRILEPEATKRGIAMNADLVKDALYVRADLVHLQQVLLNLAINGMDAMLDCTQDRRKLAFETALVGRSQVELSVADCGPGIPVDKLKTIFESFVTTKAEGTGLGLSIARTIVETYGGRLWAENKLGSGAVFRFTLPLARAHPA